MKPKQNIALFLFLALTLASYTNSEKSSEFSNKTRVNENFQHILGSETNLLKLIDYRTLFANSNGIPNRSINAFSTFFKNVIRLEYAHHAYYLIDFSFLVLIKTYILARLKMLRDKNCCSLVIFITDLRKSFLALSRRFVQNKHDEEAEQRLKDYGEMPLPYEIRFKNENEKKQSRSKCVSVFTFILLCLVLGYLTLAAYGFYAVTLKVPFRDILNSSGGGGLTRPFSLLEKFPSFVEEKLSLRSVRLTDLTRKQFADTHKKSVKKSQENAYQLQQLIRTVCNSEFLNPLINLNSSTTKFGLFEPYSSGTPTKDLKSLKTGFLQIVSDLKHLKQYFPDETSAGNLFNRMTEIESGKAGAKKVPVSPQAKAAMDFFKEFGQNQILEYLEESEVDLFLEELNEFTRRIDDDFLPLTVQITEWCHKQAESIFTTQQEMQVDLEKHLNAARRFVNEDVEYVNRQLHQIRQKDLAKVAGKIARRMNFDVKKLIAPMAFVSIVLALYIIAILNAICCPIIGPMFSFCQCCARHCPCSQFRLEYWSNLCMNSLNFFDFANVPVYVYVIGTVMMIQVIFESNYALWMPYYAGDGELMSNVLTSQRLSEIFGVQNSAETPSRLLEKTFHQFRGLCATNEVFEDDLQLSTKFEAYLADFKAKRVTEMKTEIKFAHHAKIKQIPRIKTLESLNLANLTTVYRHLLVLDSLKDDQLKKLAIPSERYELAKKVGNLKYMVGLTHDLYKNFAESYSLWLQMVDIFDGKGHDDLLGVSDYAEATVLGEIYAFEAKMRHELAAHTFECKSINRAISKIGHSIASMFNTHYAILILLTKAAQLINWLHILLILQLFISNGIWSPTELKLYTRINLATLVGIVY